VRGLHAKIGEDHGEYAANRLLALLAAAYAKGGDLWTGTSPTKGVQRFREKSRDRFLQGSELPAFFAALNDKETNATIRDVVLTCLMTGARKANVMAMRWDQVNLDGGTWRIPETKNGQPLTVPLAPEMVKLLNDRRKADAGGEWVFPGYGVTGHVVEIKASWKEILDRAGLKDLRVHDLRRTLGSWQAAAGSSLAIIGKSLGHKSQQTTAIYARLAIEPVRASVNTAVSAMTAAAAVKGKE
jgi:integrase